MSGGKLDYDKFFAVFFDIKVMKAEVFAKGVETCRLLSRLPGENVENLDAYGCPKNQDLVGEGKANSLWICCSYPFGHKTRLHSAERNAKLYEECAMQRLQILYVFFVFASTTNLDLYTRHDFFYSVHFKKLSFLNR